MKKRMARTAVSSTVVWLAVTAVACGGATPAAKTKTGAKPVASQEPSQTDERDELHNAVLVTAALSGDTVTVKVFACPCKAGTRNDAGMCRFVAEPAKAAACANASKQDGYRSAVTMDKCVEASACTEPMPGVTIQAALTSIIEAKTGPDGSASIDLNGFPPMERNRSTSTPSSYVHITAKTSDGRTWHAADNPEISSAPVFAEWMQGSDKKQAQTKAETKAETEAKKNECANGKPESCYELGVLACWGRRGQVDPSERKFPCMPSFDESGKSVPAGLAYFHKACQLRHQPSCAAETQVQAQASQAQAREGQRACADLADCQRARAPIKTCEQKCGGEQCLRAGPLNSAPWTACKDRAMACLNQCSRLPVACSVSREFDLEEACKQAGGNQVARGAVPQPAQQRAPIAAPAPPASPASQPWVIHYSAATCSDQKACADVSVTCDKTGQSRRADTCFMPGGRCGWTHSHD